MSDRSRATDGPRRRRLPVIVVGVLAAVVLLAVLSSPKVTEPGVAAPQSASTDASRTSPVPEESSAKPVPAVTTTTEPAPESTKPPGKKKRTRGTPKKNIPLDPKEVAKESKAALATYLGLFDSALQGETIAQADLLRVSTGSATTELQAAASDYAEQGFLQVGDAKVLGVEFPKMTLHKKRPRVTAQACVDARKVDVIDGTGMSLREFLFRPGEPVLQTFEITLEKSAWRVSARHISDEVVPCTR